MDMKKLLSIVDHSGVQQKAVITEGVSAPTVSKTEQYFKAVNNEVLQNINEQHAQKKIEVKRIVSRVLDKLDEGKTTKDKPAVRNFVAKNAPKAGAGAHKDKKKAEKQGDIKHKKELVPMDEERTEVRDKDGKVTSWKDEGEWKKSTANKDGRGKVTNLSDKARRETEKLSKKEKNLAEGRDGNEVEEFLHKVAQSGDNGFDMLYNAQQGKYGREIERAVQDMYDDITIDTGYHGDDDFEQIYDRMLDNIEADYGQQGVEEAGMYRQSGSRSAYDRDERASKQGFDRPERDMSDESNLLYIYKDGRVKQRMVSNTVEREARAEGFRDTPEQALKMHGIIRSKFKPGKWVQKQGDQWMEVFPFGKPDDIAETATPGATSAGNVATLGMNPKLSPGPARGKKSYIGTPGKSGTKAPPQPKVNQPKTKHGTAVNALDMKSNIFGGGKAIKRK